MDDFKIEMFEKEKGECFPTFYKLNNLDCDMLYDLFSKIMQVSDCFPSVFAIFERNSDFIEEFNALEDDFHYSSLMSYLGLTNDITFINWDDFKEIDVMKTNDFSKYFYDIWFPSSDNIICFPPDMSLLIMIRHDGAIFVKRNPTKNTHIVDFQSD